MYHLNELTNLSTRIAKLLLLASSATLLMVINGKSLCENSYKRTISRKIYRAIVLDEFVSVLI